MTREDAEKSAREASVGPNHSTPKLAKLPTMDLRKKRRRAGDALRLFEEIIDRSLPAPGRAGAKRRSLRPRFVPGRPHEIVIWEASDSSDEETDG